jgi:hypothetical protein
MSVLHHSFENDAIIHDLMELAAGSHEIESALT